MFSYYSLDTFTLTFTFTLFFRPFIDLSKSLFQKIFMLYLWVYFCVKVEENGVYSEVKYGSKCNSD